MAHAGGGQARVTHCLTRQTSAGVPVNPTWKQIELPKVAPDPLIVTVTVVEAPGASGGIAIDAGVMFTLLVVGEKVIPVAVKPEILATVMV